MWLQWNPLLPTNKLSKSKLISPHISAQNQHQTQSAVAKHLSTCDTPMNSNLQFRTLAHWSRLIQGPNTQLQWLQSMEVPWTHHDNMQSHGSRGKGIFTNPRGSRWSLWKKGHPNLHWELLTLRSSCLKKLSIQRLSGKVTKRPVLGSTTANSPAVLPKQNSLEKQDNSFRVYKTM